MSEQSLATLTLEELKQLGRESGRQNSPDSGAHDWMEQETRLVKDAEMRLQRETEGLKTEVCALNDKFKKMETDLGKTDRINARHSSILIQSDSMASNAMGQSYREVVETRASLSAYIISKNIECAPIYPDIMEIGLLGLVCLLFVEIVPGSIVFSQHLQGGIVDAGGLALLLGFVNTFGLMLIGVGACNLRIKGWERFALFLLTAGAILALILNVVVILWRSKLVAAYDSVPLLFESPPVEIKTLLFGVVSMIVALWSGYKGYGLGGNDPEYATRDRKFQSASEQYHEKRKFERKRILGVAGRLEQAINKEFPKLKDCSEEIDELEQKIVGYRRQAQEITDNVSDNLRHRLQAFRDGNKASRTTPPPAYFEHPIPTMKCPGKLLETLTDADTKIRSARSEMSNLQENFKIKLDEAVSVVAAEAERFDHRFPEISHPILDCRN